VGDIVCVKPVGLDDDSWHRIVASVELGVRGLRLEEDHERLG
jgi:hypothetical protein